MTSERISDEQLAECMEYATHEADMSGNAARVNPDHVDDARFYRNLEAALTELQSFRAREAEVEAKLAKVREQLLEPVPLGSSWMREWDKRLTRMLAILDGDNDE
ncbi:hypothetical protein [Gulosibacter molinativorax]|uniref:Uncharacterized protein n=1 Tax=Gulosibacter molinativorax TaxID=256821 RepID=A0ABT7C6D2_9MICO|nr:hypothetical protein [Gulosibacter molinativorax]MDJ1370648.1 hypothetical protein [Gulosibacter molinativorax]QUY63327.1 Hypotetical protein [Gulosibacter molinativorax]